VDARGAQARNGVSIQRLDDIINNSDNIVFFGGAGVSTESGIPDFRSAGGLYGDPRNARGGGSRENGNSPDGGVRGGGAPYESVPPETLLSHSFFISRTGDFFDFYKKKMLYLDAEPNKAHYKLAELERAGRLRAVITQNIDGLHQKAGSKNVVELHGSVYRNYCRRCKKAHDVRRVAEADGVPTCDCGGVIKPGVVLYEESLDQGDIARAVEYIAESDVLIIGGTSLVVYPAAGLIRYYTGNKLIIINKSETDSDFRALLTIRQGIAEVMGAITVRQPSD